MACTSCNHGREILKQGARELMMFFIDNGDDGRKAFYIQNVRNAWTLWKDHLVPFEWAGFVHHSSRTEFEHYFQEDINIHLSPQLLEDLATYKYSTDHGNLYQVIVDKLRK